MLGRARVEGWEERIGKTPSVVFEVRVKVLSIPAADGDADGWDIKNGGEI